MRSRILARVVAVTALGVALTACGNSSDPVGSVGSGPATGDAAPIEAADGDRFTPATLELPAGEKVTIEITNADDRAHDFAIEAAGLNTGTIQGGAVATATFTVPEGTTEFVCTFHRGMTGTIKGIAQSGWLTSRLSPGTKVSVPLAIGPLDAAIGATSSSPVSVAPRTTRPTM